jgi:hypothetical protein
MEKDYMRSTSRRFQALLFAAAVPFLSGALDAQSFSPEAVWRCSLDNKTYRIQVTDGFVRILPVRTGVLHANLPVKTDKKGREIVMGQWQSSQRTGFLSITEIDDQRVAGHMLIPRAGTAPDGCATRTLAVLTVMANANNGRSGCDNVAVSWNLDNNLTLAEAAAEEAPVEARPPAAITVSEFGQTQTGNPSVGVWVYEDAGSVHYTHIELTLRSDGTYTKTLQARTPGWGGGGVVGAAGLGGTHSGTWTANGSVVHLSGDGNWPPYDHNLTTFRKIR